MTAVLSVLFCPLPDSTPSCSLVERMEKGDVLIVTKLDRLGRDAIDVSTTVAKLEEIGVCSG